MKLGGIDPVGGLIGLGSFLLAIALGVAVFKVQDPKLAQLLKSLMGLASLCALVAAVLLGSAIVSGTSDQIAFGAGPSDTAPLSTNDTSTPPGATTVHAAPTPLTTLTRAQVINTGPPGVSRYTQPYLNSGHVFGPLENELIEVVCQVRDGQPVSDNDPAPGQPSNWPVWDKLADGYYIPDVWTNLPKDPGLIPPRGIPPLLM